MSSVVVAAGLCMTAVTASRRSRIVLSRLAHSRTSERKCSMMPDTRTALRYSIIIAMIALILVIIII